MNSFEQAGFDHEMSKSAGFNIGKAFGNLLRRRGPNHGIPGVPSAMHKTEATAKPKPAEHKPSGLGVGVGAAGIATAAAGTGAIYATSSQAGKLSEDDNAFLNQPNSVY